MILLGLHVALALGFSFLCSIMEAVLLSATPSYVATMEATGGAVGRRFALTALPHCRWAGPHPALEVR
jgi:hypothetical protein